MSTVSNLVNLLEVNYCHLTNHCQSQTAAGQGNLHTLGSLKTVTSPERSKVQNEVKACVILGIQYLLHMIIKLKQNIKAVYLFQLKPKASASCL